MKTALVVGGSGGIGSEVAKRLFREGYWVAISYNTNKKGAKKLSRELGDCPYLHCDLSDPYEVELMFKTCEDLLGRIDVVVNCTGIASQGLLQEMSDDDIKKVIDIDLVGTIFIVRAAAKSMLKRHSGSIINISSIWGVRGASCEAVYSAAKGGIISFTKAMAKELAPSDIRVNCVSPGVIKTSMLDVYSDEDLDVLAVETPLSRLGSAGDVAGVVTFLAGDDSSFITGQNIVVDGGFIL